MKNLLSCFVLIVLNFHVFAGPALQPARLSCDYQVNPLGIDNRAPAFSWTLKSAERNQLQSAYELIVSDDLQKINAGAGDHWSTGKISSAQNVFVIYKGKTLQSRTRYYWRVQVYDRNGNASGWSTAAWFETGMFNQDDWKASWINDGKLNPANDSNRYQDDRLPMLKKQFALSKKISSARLYISGMGYYEAYLNGKKIGDHVLDPGFTTYKKEVLYAVYDISALLRKGNNTAGVMLGNGWWNPLPFKLFGRWDLRDYQQTGRPCVKAEIHIRFADGTTSQVITDESWLTTPGATTRNNIYLGEHYDARLETAGWLSNNAPGNTAVSVPGPQGKLVAQQQPAIKITKLVKPVAVTKLNTDTFIVDMGQNFAGVVRIKVKGTAGKKITMRFGEALLKDGSLNYMTTVATQIKKGGIKAGPGAPLTAWQEDSYILKGKGTETWAPKFSFHGLRYVEVTGWPGVPSVNDFEGLRMNSDLEQDGDFSCSNEMFNQLHQAIQWTFLSNVFSVQSDCPAREKMGYGGDMVATGNAYLYNYNMGNFYRKAVNDFANEQRPQGGITEIAPFTGIADRGYGDDSGPLGWQLAFAFLQKQLYDQYGDVQVIAGHYPAFQKQLSFLASKTTDGLFYWDIGDHEALDTKADVLSANCFYYHHLILAAEFAGILKNESDSLQYTRVAAQLKRTMISKFLVPGTGRFDNGTQAAQLFALNYDLSPERETTMKVFLDEVKRHDGHLSTGIFSTKMLFDVLRKADMNDVAYSIANQRAFPGWGHMLSGGATTLWETWEYPESSPSQNHPMFGSVDEWFYRSLLGINAAAPGFEKIIIKPQPAGDLSWARGSYNSVRGIITSEWKQATGNFELKVTIPANTTAAIWIPCKENGAVTEGGNAVPGIHYSNGYAIIETGSGAYTFTSIL